MWIIQFSVTLAVYFFPVVCNTFLNMSGVVIFVHCALVYNEEVYNLSSEKPL